jgi:RIO-like serine/threonine protein kinase
MELIRENKEKHRSTYFCGDRYRKEWGNVTPVWISYHVQLLNKVVPGYVINFGDNWIEYKIIPGVPASTFTHTPEFIKKIYTFCLDNIQETYPYAHGDWALSNILINGDNIKLCDWDNLEVYPADEVKTKLFADLTDAFGKEFLLHVQQLSAPNVHHQILDLRN